jgi:hypothetical protein
MIYFISKFMKNVLITLEKQNKDQIVLEYQPFNLIHSHLWIKSLESAEKNGMKIIGDDRIYHFSNNEEEMHAAIEKCNAVIDKINAITQQNLPQFDPNYPQQSVNLLHTFFVDEEKKGTIEQCGQLWHELNFYLHGIEILYKSNRDGQIFFELLEKDYFDLPEESFDYFTMKMTYGYCYANYAHIGRHVLQAYHARDENSHSGYGCDEDIVPMTRISGSSYLWFGKTYTDEFVNQKMLSVEKWYKDNDLENSISLPWGDKKLALGWLPVAQLNHTVTPEHLFGISRISGIQLK